MRLLLSVDGHCGDVLSCRVRRTSSAPAGGGEGPDPAIALRTGARLLRDDPVTAARGLTTTHRT